MRADPPSVAENRLADYRICVAPMMEWTDRHCRYLLRLISPRVRLYTEMVHARAVVQGDRARLLGFDPAEHPLALQLGGSEPEALGEAAAIAEQFGYDEVNLNVGCPSDRVQSGRFGACLMAEPERVADCVSAMRARVGIPVTVKTRIGIDDHDDYAFLLRFVDTVAAAGCEVFVVHARKAILQGLSPKANREVPPLDYGRVHRLKAERPQLAVVLNGGVRDLAGIEQQLQRVDGVMIGREAYQNPWFLAEVEAAGFGLGSIPPPSRRAIIDRYLEYVTAQLERGHTLAAMSRHLFGLYHGQPGARRWRHRLSEAVRRAGAGPEAIRAALPDAGR